MNETDERYRVVQLAQTIARIAQAVRQSQELAERGIDRRWADLEVREAMQVLDRLSPTTPTGSQPVILENPSAGPGFEVSAQRYLASIHQSAIAVEDGALAEAAAAVAQTGAALERTPTDWIRSVPAKVSCGDRQPDTVTRSSA